ncbi:unnamed protein product [Polarella glacialis]|uniref:Uncharacterized protein n=1 Tax=Polarella glacialis TaxID=89957 RepID=A0A813GJ43_POLGL|nr:unnamed protein product [Polarella glacialis]
MLIQLVSHEVKASDASACAAGQGGHESGEQSVEELVAAGEIPECATQLPGARCGNYAMHTCVRDDL